MRKSFRLDASGLIKGIYDFEVKSDQAMYAYAETAAARLAGWARKDAPWTNRTGHARQRLNAKSERIKTGYRITLAHGVWYGVYLEYANNKKWATIEPTIIKRQDEVIKGWQKVAFNRW